MAGLLTAATESSMPVLVFGALAALVLGSWAWGKYREYQAGKRSEEIRNLYATIHSERVTGKTTDRRTSSPA